jgi:DNA polymerase-1
MRLVIDLETDNLLFKVTKIHCIAVVDVDSSYSELFVGHEGVLKFRKKLEENPSIELVGHNIFNFDIKVLEKLYGLNFKGKIHDTMVLGQLLFADLKNDDEKEGIFPGKVFSSKEKGNHSLKAWGQRVMCYKGEYSGTWEEPNAEMFAYCIKDTNTTKVLFKFLESKIYDKLLTLDPIQLEYDISPILARLQARGVQYNREKADKLIGLLTERIVECTWKLREIFKPRFISKGETTPKRSYKFNCQNFTKDAPYTKIQLEEFNPGSRGQVISRLIKEFGWNPEEFTDKGNVKMDEDIIENLPFPELLPLKEYLTCKKRISQIETGKGAWGNKVDEDGRIRGAIRQNGTITGRAAHWGPNLGQVPASDSLWGPECRELFEAPSDKVMIGCDADSIEMRCLAGYLLGLDNGRFRDSILTGNKEEGTDPHTINMHAYQIENRDCAKTQFYGDIYGSKNAKKGKILMDYGVKLEEYVPDFEESVIGMMEWVDKKNRAAIEKGEEPMLRTEAYWRCWVAGKHLAKLFGDKIPELQKLRDMIKAKVKETGFIKGLDGRKLFMRSEHSQLNTVLQSAAALIMKKALKIADDDLQAEGLVPGKDYEFILWVHDEYELEVQKDLVVIDKVSRIVPEAIKKAGEAFGFPCPQKGNVKVGNNWSEVH